MLPLAVSMSSHLLLTVIYLAGLSPTTNLIWLLKYHFDVLIHRSNDLFSIFTLSPCSMKLYFHHLCPKPLLPGSLAPLSAVSPPHLGPPFHIPSVPAVLPLASLSYIQLFSELLLPSSDSSTELNISLTLHLYRIKM